MKIIAMPQNSLQSKTKCPNTLIAFAMVCISWFFIASCLYIIVMFIDYCRTMHMWAGQSSGWSFPKFHCMPDRAIIPLLVGCAENASTNSGEHGHIDKVKNPARFINRKGDWESQLLLQHTRRAATHALSKQEKRILSPTQCFQAMHRLATLLITLQCIRCANFAFCGDATCCNAF